MPRFDLVVTDLDGTLWGTDLTITQRTRDAIATLGDAGVEVLVATGRRTRSAGEPLAANGIDHLPLVLLNGALGLCDEGRFHERRFSSTQTEAILDEFQNHGHVPCAYVEGAGSIDVYCPGEPTTGARHRATLADAVHVGPRGPLGELGPFGFSVLGVERGPLEAIADTLEQTEQATTSFGADGLYGGHSLQAQPPGVTKWLGIDAWCARRDIDPERVLVVGDGNNDLEMMRRASVSVAVETATVAALELADEVLPGPDADGWGDVVDLVLDPSPMPT